MKKTIFGHFGLASTILLFSLVLLFIPTQSVRAQIPLNFGGFQTFSLPCTCSIPGTFWVWYFPLYYNSNIPISGPMVYTPIFSTLYSNYEIVVPFTWELGNYVPDVGTCWIYIGVACVPLPSLGLMNQVGTS
jgi:hypothetical protein